MVAIITIRLRDLMEMFDLVQSHMKLVTCVPMMIVQVLCEVKNLSKKSCDSILLFYLTKFAHTYMQPLQGRTKSANN